MTHKLPNLLLLHISLTHIEVKRTKIIIVAYSLLETVLDTSVTFISYNILIKYIIKPEVYMIMRHRNMK